MSTLSKMAQQIERDYRQLKRTPSGKRYAARYDSLRQLVRAEQDALIELLLSGRILSDTGDYDELMMFGGHGGSVARKHNAEWWGFMEKLRTHRAELPPVTVILLDWLWEEHGW